MAITREPFPAQQLAILAICRLAEPIAFTSILAYNYPFVQEVRGTPDNAAFYAGLLVSAFALAEASTAVLWGTVSDRYGRKPVVLSGLVGVALSSLMFGLTKNYWVAFAARAIGGLLNGNVSVMQTMVAEMVKSPEHEPLAYSMMPFMWFFGSILGSSMGALLAHPALLWPVFKGTIFDKYPFFLPNLVAASFITFAVILGVLFLKETRVWGASEEKTSYSDVDERTSLLRENDWRPHNDPTVQERTITLPSLPDNARSTKDDSTVTVSAVDDCVVEVGSDQKEQDTIAPLKSSPGWNRNMILLVLHLSLLSYIQMGYSVLIPIYLVDASTPGIPEGHFDPFGGFGFTVRQVGGVMSVNGFIALIVQGVIFTPFVRKVGVWKTFVWLTILAPTAYAAVPFITLIPRSHTLAAVYLDLFAQNFMGIIVYPCLLILLKDSTPSLSILGQVNGVAMTCCSAARTIASPLVGYIYGLGGSAVGWWSVSLVALIAGLLVPTVSRPLPAMETREDESGE